MSETGKMRVTQKRDRYQHNQSIKWSEVKVTYSQVWWPILGIHALHLPIQVHTHSSEHTHTHHEHTPRAVGSHLCCGTQGAVGAQGHLVGVLKVERALNIHSPHRQSLPDRDSNSQPFDFESDDYDSIMSPLPLGHDFPKYFFNLSLRDTFDLWATS